MQERPRRVLIVEDEQTHAALAVEIFQEPPAWETAWVPDGEEALRFLRKAGKYAQAWTPDLVLLNHVMPKRRGLEVLQEMKSHPELTLIPVVMWSIGKEEEEIAQAYRLGASAYFAKPVDVRDMEAQLRIIRRFWDYAQSPPRDNKDTWPAYQT